MRTNIQLYLIILYFILISTSYKNLHTESYILNTDSPMRVSPILILTLRTTSSISLLLAVAVLNPNVFGL